MNAPTISVVIPCYRDAKRAGAAARAACSQGDVASIALEVIIVDDGSGLADNLLLQEDASRLDRVTVLSLPRNAGRSVARNAGAAAARGEYLLFMDSDCLPLGNWASLHAATLANGAIASTGDVQGSGDSGFWDMYQRRASKRRARLHGAGADFAGSSQNLAVRRSAFREVGGFDEGYSRYGFEDRDLLARLAQLGPIRHEPDAIVAHQDHLCMLGTARKMRESAVHSSDRFRLQHPEAYRRLGYAAADVALKPWLWPLVPLARLCVEPMAKALDALERRGAVPFWIGAIVVKLVSALAYLDGTALREASVRNNSE